MSQRIRIKLKAHGHHRVDKSTQRIIKALTPTGARIIGPIPLPTKKQKFSVIKSPHVYKKSGETFKLLTHQRVIGVEMSTTAKSHEVLDALVNIELQAGVDVDINELLND